MGSIVSPSESMEFSIWTILLHVVDAFVSLVRQYSTLNLNGSFYTLVAKYTIIVYAYIGKLEKHFFSNLKIRFKELNFEFFEFAPSTFKSLTIDNYMFEWVRIIRILTPEYHWNELWAFDFKVLGGNRDGV